MSLHAIGEAGAAPGYRVVQWATGNIGTRALRSVIEHPDLTLAGVYVHSPGQGREGRRRAVRAAPRPVSSPPCDGGRDPGARRRLRAVHAGRLRLRPGVPAARLRRERRHHPGRVPSSGQHRSCPPQAGRGRLRPGRQLDPQHREQSRVHHRGDPAGADVDPAAVRRPGDQRVRRSLAARLAGPAVQRDGLREARRGVRRAPVLLRADQLRAVEGDAPLDIDIRFPVPLERMGATSPAYTANRAVNAVPFVCAAPPGIRTTVDLPQIVASFG